jgi:hypothetical protein
MKNVLLGVLLGVALVVLAGWVIKISQPQRSEAEAVNIVSVFDRVEREEQYATGSTDLIVKEQASEFQSIADIMKVKSDFKQTELLYALAGRAKVRRLVALTKEADAIADSSDRSYALSILFSRLTELSPELALEAVGDERFLGDESLSRSIWRTWARLDFDSALTAVTELTPRSRKESAARAMYWAVGVFGNSKTEQIKAMTGVNPTLWSISQTIEAIARTSVPEAIVKINQLHSVQDQRYVANAVAMLAAAKAPKLALSHAYLFKSGAVRDHYRIAVLRTIGSNSPQTVLQNWSASNYQSKDVQGIYSALTQYAFEDFEQAMSYVDQMPDSKTKTGLIKVLLAVKSRENAIDALSLAQQYEQVGNEGLVNYLVTEMITVSPASALLALEALPDIPNYKLHVARAVGGLAQLDPNKAVAKIQLLSDNELRELANQELVVAWAQIDVNAALSYALTQDSIGKPVGVPLRDVDLDLGMRFLDKFSSPEFSINVYTFAADLAARYSASELVGMLSPYSSNAQFDVIKTSILSTLSTGSDRDAQYFIDTFWADDEKSFAYLSYAQTIAYKNPEVALNMLGKLDNIEDQQSLLQMVISRTSYRDKNAARQMLSRLESAELRDIAVSTLSHRFSPDSKNDIALINSIEEPRVRETAILNMLYASAKTEGMRVVEQARELGLSQKKIDNLKLLVECRDADVHNSASRRKCGAVLHK